MLARPPTAPSRSSAHAPTAFLAHRFRFPSIRSLRMKLPAMILTLTLMELGGLGCAAAEKKAGAATQPAQQWSEPGVSLKAEVSREDGVTRIDFAWSGLKEPGVLVVNFDSSDEYFARTHPGAFRNLDLYGVTLTRQAPPSGGVSVSFDDRAMRDLGILRDDLLVLNAYLADGLTLAIRDDVTVRGAGVSRTQQVFPADCSPKLTMVPDIAGTTAQTVFREPPIETMNLNLSPPGGAIVRIGEGLPVRSYLQLAIDIHSTRGQGKDANGARHGHLERVGAHRMTQAAGLQSKSYAGAKEEKP